MGLIQPPPIQDRTWGSLAWLQWFNDLWNKLKGTQTQVNSTLQVIGMTTSNNSPSGGQISWSACTVYYNGTAYPIAAGNAGTNQFVWWVVGSATFSSGNTYTPSPTLFPILTNVAGTADLTWNKLGAGGVRGAHCNFESIYLGPNGPLFLEQITFTSTPGTGVSWSSGAAYYNGVGYTVAAGSCDNSHFWIYWQLSNPTVFQVSATYPTLGADDFLIGVNGSSGNPAQLGNFARAFQLKQGNGQTVYITADGSMFGFNNQGTQTFGLGRTSTDGPGSPATGKFLAFDGAGHVNAELDGSNGVLQLRNTSGNPFSLTNITLVGAAGTVAGYLTLAINGSTFKIQILNP